MIKYLIQRKMAFIEFFKAWNGSDEFLGWAIIDCMMNIPILYRASEELKDIRFANAAIRFADKTMKYHVL